MAGLVIFIKPRDIFMAEKTCTITEAGVGAGVFKDGNEKAEFNEQVKAPEDTVKALVGKGWAVSGKVNLASAEDDED